MTPSPFLTGLEYGRGVTGLRALVGGEVGL